MEPPSRLLFKPPLTLEIDWSCSLVPYHGTPRCSSGLGYSDEGNLTLLFVRPSLYTPTRWDLEPFQTLVIVFLLNPSNFIFFLLAIFWKIQSTKKGVCLALQQAVFLIIPILAFRSILAAQSCVIGREESKKKER